MANKETSALAPVSASQVLVGTFALGAGLSQSVVSLVASGRISNRNYRKNRTMENCFICQKLLGTENVYEAQSRAVQSLLQCSEIRNIVEHKSLLENVRNMYIVLYIVLATSVIQI